MNVTQTLSHVRVDCGGIPCRFDMNDPASAPDDIVGAESHHYYRTPGVYTIKAYPLDGSAVQSATVTIAVDPRPVVQIAAGQPAEEFKPNTRYLFQRGGTWGTGAGVTWNLPSRCTIGAYGTGEKPVFKVTFAPGIDGGCVFDSIACDTPSYFIRPTIKSLNTNVAIDCDVINATKFWNGEMGGSFCLIRCNSRTELSLKEYLAWIGNHPGTGGNVAEHWFIGGCRAKYAALNNAVVRGHSGSFGTICRNALQSRDANGQDGNTIRIMEGDAVWISNNELAGNARMSENTTGWTGGAGAYTPTTLTRSGFYGNVQLGDLSVGHGASGLVIASNAASCPRSWLNLSPLTYDALGVIVPGKIDGVKVNRNNFTLLDWSDQTWGVQGHFLTLAAGASNVAATDNSAVLFATGGKECYAVNSPVPVPCSLNRWTVRSGLPAGMIGGVKQSKASWITSWPTDQVREW